MPDSIKIATPGKLNLGLAVGPVPDDSRTRRHQICTWIVSINLYDELTVTRLPLDRFSRYAIFWHDTAIRKSAIDWPITKDLAVRAHLLLETETRTPMPLQLRLEKRLPVGAGLGGGSSDAAAMLTACNELFELGLSLPELKKIGAKLGSDVPFFLEGGPSLATGFGENLRALDHPSESEFVLIFPEFQCNTAQVYRAFDDLTTQAQMTRIELAERFANASDLLTTAATSNSGQPIQPSNDLTWAAFSLHPQLRTLQSEISELIESPVYLTGSGSTLFALCGHPGEADFIAQAISERIKGTMAVAARIHQHSGS